MKWPGLVSGEALRMRAFTEGELPRSPAGRLAFITEALHGGPLFDEDDNPTEPSEPWITKEQAAKLPKETA